MPVLTRTSLTPTCISLAAVLNNQSKSSIKKSQKMECVDLTGGDVQPVSQAPVTGDKENKDDSRDERNATASLLRDQESVVSAFDSVDATGGRIVKKRARQPTGQQIGQVSVWFAPAS